MIKRTKHLQSGNSPKGISNLSWDSVWLYGFILACGFTSFYVYFCQIILPGRIAAFEIYGKILSRSAESPYAYRILAPFLIKALSAPLALTGLLKPKTAFLAGYSVFVLTSVELSVVLLFRLLRFWFDARFSLIGILLFCLMLRLQPGIISSNLGH